jgi:hypothetical protein
MTLADIWRVMPALAAASPSDPILKRRIATMTSMRVTRARALRMP